MTAEKLDGTATAAAIKEELKHRVAALRDRGVVPGLGTILVGDDPGSRWYVNGKHKDCAEVGIDSIREDLPETATQDEIEAAVARLNADPDCTGYIVQLPLPRGRDENRVLGMIDPAKDADGLHPTSLGWLVLGKEAPLPCTPRGIVELLRRHDVPIAGAEVVVVGRGVTVGRPLGLLLTRRSENATVTLCHTGTRDLAAHTRNGPTSWSRRPAYPASSRGDMVKPGRRRTRRRRLAGRRQARRRRGARRLGRGGVGVAEPRRRRPDDARDAALEHRRPGREGAGVIAVPQAACT